MDEIKSCPCGSEQPFAQCAKGISTVPINAPNGRGLDAFAVLAYVTANIDYIQQTLLPQHAIRF